MNQKNILHNCLFALLSEIKETVASEKVFEIGVSMKYKQTMVVTGKKQKSKYTIQNRKCCND
jgi:hypothetical protein